MQRADKFPRTQKVSGASEVRPSTDAKNETHVINGGCSCLASSAHRLHASSQDCNLISWVQLPCWAPAVVRGRRCECGLGRLFARKHTHSRTQMLCFRRTRRATAIACAPWMIALALCKGAGDYPSKF